MPSAVVLQLPAGDNVAHGAPWCCVALGAARPRLAGSLLPALLHACFRRMLVIMHFQPFHSYYPCPDVLRTMHDAPWRLHDDGFIICTEIRPSMCC